MLFTMSFYMHTQFEVPFIYFKVKCFSSFFVLSLQVHFYHPIPTHTLNQAIRFNYLLYLLSCFSFCSYHHIQLITTRLHYENMTVTCFAFLES